MCSLIPDSNNELDKTTDEYIFMRESLKKVEIIFIRGEENIALNLAKQICEYPWVEITQKILNEILQKDSDSEIRCRDVIISNIDIMISKELLQEMCDKICQKKLRWIIIGKSRIPNGVEKMAVVEIRPEQRCSISRKEGIEIEMLGPNCAGLTPMGLRYASIGYEVCRKDNNGR